MKNDSRERPISSTDSRNRRSASQRPFPARHFISRDYKFGGYGSGGRLNVPTGEQMIRISLPRFLGNRKKITRLARKYIRSTSRTAEHGQKPSSRIPSRSNSPGHHRQWVPARPSTSSPTPPSLSVRSPSSPFDRPPPSTTFQFILSCWLARFTTKFPLARRSSLRKTLYLPPPLFYPALYPASPFYARSRYLILFPYIFIFFFFSSA